MTDDRPPYAGVPEIVPRPHADLEPLLGWLRGGEGVAERRDFPAGTALPDGRLDLCKQALGPEGAAAVAEALRQAPATGAVRHLLLGTDGLGDTGAAAVTERAGGTGVETLYLGCNGITAGGACRIADNLRASPQAVTGVWLKRNPLGGGAGEAGAGLVESARSLRTLDLVQTGLDPAGLAVLADALVVAARLGRAVERLFVGGNALGTAGAACLGTVITAGAVAELYVSAAGLGDEGALVLAEALARAPHGRLTGSPWPATASDRCPAPAWSPPRPPRVWNSWTWDGSRPPASSAPRTTRSTSRRPRRWPRHSPRRRTG